MDKYKNCGPKKHFGDDKNSWNSAKTALFLLFGLYVIHIPHLCLNFYENQTQKTNFWRKLLRKSHKNQTQQKKNFWRKTLRKSYFLKKKKHFLIFCSIFVKKKNNNKIFFNDNFDALSFSLHISRECKLRSNLTFSV